MQKKKYFKDTRNLPVNQGYLRLKGFCNFWQIFGTVERHTNSFGSVLQDWNATELQKKKEKKKHPSCMMICESIIAWYDYEHN